MPICGDALASLSRVEFARAERHGQSDKPAQKELVCRSLSHGIAAFEKARTAFKPGTVDDRGSWPIWAMFVCP
jgi:hypothetical protein